MTLLTQHYARLLDGTPALIAYLGPDLRYRYVNARYAELFECTAEAIVGRRVEDVLPIYEQVAGYLRRALQGETLQYEVQLGREGQRRYVRSHCMPDVQDGEVQGILVVVVDIHDLRLAERANHRLRHALDHAMAGFSLHDAEGRFIYVNQAEADMYGYTREELLGQTWRIQYTPETVARIETEIFPEVERTLGWRGELMARRKNGETFPVEIALSLLTDTDGRPDGLVCTCSDITERRLAESSLRQLKKMDAIGKLTGGVAHDFNNLLMVILSELDLALDDLTDTEAVRHSVENARAAGERAAKLTKKLLTFARERTVAKSAIRVPELFRSLQPLLRRAVGENVEVVVELDDDLWRCQADAAETENVLLNLALNARDAMPEGGRLSVRASNVRYDAAEGMRSAGAYVRLEVEDTGQGMAPEVLDRLYEPFFTTKPPGRGSGLGLSMAYGFARQSGGALTVTSTLGRGSTFALELPRADDGDAAKSEPPHPSEAAAPECVRAVLLVEDNAAIRHAVTQMLTRRGVDVVEADAAETALVILDGPTEFDVVLSDVVLAGPRTGVDLLREVRRLRPGLPVALMTGYASPSHGLDALDVPVLRKPFATDALWAVLHALAPVARPPAPCAQ